MNRISVLEREPKDTDGQEKSKVVLEKGKDPKEKKSPQQEIFWVGYERCYPQTLKRRTISKNPFHQNPGILTSCEVIAVVLPLKKLLKMKLK